MGNLQRNTANLEFKSLRLSKGFTQKGLGDTCGINQTRMSYFEMNYEVPSKEELGKLSKALGVGIKKVMDTFHQTLEKIKNEREPRQEKR